MPVVTIHMEKGRPIEMKRALADGVSKAVTVALDVPPGWVTIVTDEIERENWGKSLIGNDRSDPGTPALGGQLQVDKFGPDYGRAGVKD